MLTPPQIFENEEAEKLLDYFVAYKKLNSAVDCIRCAAKMNSEITFCENITQPPNDSHPIKLTEIKHQ
jgi:hypothetical protein